MEMYLWKMRECFWGIRKAEKNYFEEEWFFDNWFSWRDYKWENGNSSLLWW